MVWLKGPEKKETENRKGIWQKVKPFWLKWGSLLLVAYSVEITARCHNPVVLFPSYWASILFVQISEVRDPSSVHLHPYCKNFPNTSPISEAFGHKIDNDGGSCSAHWQAGHGIHTDDYSKIPCAWQGTCAQGSLGAMRLPAAGVQDVAFLKSLELEDKLREVWRVSVFLWFKQNFLFLRLGCNHTEDHRFTALLLVLVHFIVKCVFILQEDFKISYQ